MRFLTWNIDRGGGTRISEIIQELNALSPDLVALTEVTSKNLAILRQALVDAGLGHTETTCVTGGPNSVLVASRLPFEMVDDPVKHDQERWLPIRFDSLDLNVLCVHIPDATSGKYDADGYGISGKRRKENFWDEVIRYCQAHKFEKTVLLGDFNTGLKEDAQGTPFVLSENIRILRLEKYVDTWRHINPKTREYTWYSKQNSEDYNGFRLDYVFVSSALRDNILHAQHVHHVRAEKLSDHAMVLTDLSIGI